MSTAADPKVLSRRFVDFARFILDEREASGTIRGIAHERNRFAIHIETAPFAEKSIEEITRSDIEAWLREMSEKLPFKGGGTEKLSTGTIKRALSLCSKIFSAAGPDEHGLIKVNPLYGLQVDKTLQLKDEDEDGDRHWTYLTDAEQKSVATCAQIAEPDRLAMLFAIGTGLTQGEQFNLGLADVHLVDESPHVTVRVGSSGREVMKTRTRKVDLLGPSLEAVRRWLEIVPTGPEENPERVLFVARRGGRRAIGKPMGGGGALRSALAKVGITRRVRWADLRHTCAVSMALGFWGHRYSLTDIQKMLGFANVNGMGRYTALVESRLGTSGRGLATREPYGEVGAAPQPPAHEALLSAHVINAGLLRAERAEFSASAENGEESGGPSSARIPLSATAPRGWASDRLDLSAQLVAPFAAELALPPETLARAAAALSTGKHLLLVGPPGTGKTELAHALVRAAVAEGYCAGAHVATASADWTTFDTIGGYAVQRSGRLRFRPGALLRAIERCNWLVIDELNRADVDRAFGELMTVLAGRTTDTTYELDGGRTVRIGPDADASHLMPKTFRVLATMNTWDKTSLFRLSYAVQRRFAVVHVNVPDDLAYGTLLRRHAELDAPDAVLDGAITDRLVELFSSRGLLEVRAIGPAVALDVVRYVRRRAGAGGASTGNALAEALAMFVLPQLDGVVQMEGVVAYRALLSSLSNLASRPAIAELRERVEELLPHVKLPVDDA